MTVQMQDNTSIHIGEMPEDEDDKNDIAQKWRK